MNRVTGIGGVFFKARDPKALGAWYREHLGIAVEDWGGAAFRWVTDDNPTGTGTTIWNPFPATTSYFAPSESSFMINYRVPDLHALLAVAAQRRLHGGRQGGGERVRQVRLGDGPRGQPHRALAAARGQLTPS